MKLIADMHCHTIASSHAYSTILENVRVAKEKGLKYIAITDHTGEIPSSPGAWYFHNLQIIPKDIDGVCVLQGIECNVLGKSGEIDIPDLYPGQRLHWVVSSIHDCAWKGSSSLEDCTNAWINVSKNPFVNVIGHSGLVNFKYDYEEVIPIFRDNNKLVEINASSFSVRPGCRDNCKKIAEICKKCGALVIVDSDAHIAKHVGRFDSAVELLREIDFPERLIVNSSVDLFEKYLKEHTNFFG